MHELLTVDDVEAFRAIADRMRDQNGESVYGYFPGGDPREFCPDPECNSAEELEAHRVACAKWDAGEQVELPGGCPTMTGRPTSFGLGVYTVKCSDVDRLARQLDDWLDAVRKTEDMYR